MKAIINRGALLEILGQAANVVPARSPKPILGCVKISTLNEPGGNALRVMATDMEVTLESTLGQVEVKEPGSALLPAMKFLEIITNAPDDTLVLETNGDQTTITGSDSVFKLLGFNSEEFPPITGFEGQPDFSLPASTLKTMLDRTRFAAAKEMSRYAINGVLFERKGKKLMLVATDGHRLAQTQDQVMATDAKEVSSVVPLKAISLLERLLAHPEHIVHLQFRENKLYVHVVEQTADGKPAASAGTILSSVLVEGLFPPYQDVIPKDCDRKAALNREEFFSAVKRSALLTNEESKGVKLSFGPNQLVVTSRAPETGDARVNMKVSYSGEPIDIGFNPHYLADALKVATVDEVVLEMKASTKPGILRLGPDFLYVIMPVSLPS